MLRRTLKNRRITSGVLFLLGIFFLGGILVFTPPVRAQGTPNLGLTYAVATGLATTDVRIIVARVIQIFLGLLGLLTVSLIIYAGYLWMTSQGNEETITKARQLITNAVIGLAIILSAFAIVSFVVSRLLVANGGSEETGGLPGGNGFIGVGVGSSNLESHYPPRDATGIPRNTKLLVTFKVPIAPSTIIDSSDSAWNTANCQGVAPEAVCGKLAVGGSAGESNFALFPKATPTAVIAPDKMRVITIPPVLPERRQTFVFKPLDLLGSADANTDYTAVLRNRILTGQGVAVFGATGADYNWQFQVSTLIDTTPPTVVNVVPVKNATEPRNTIVQITFSEAVDPTTVTGSRAKFGVFQGTTKQNGSTTVSNGYRTVEFVTDQACGTNSCGATIYCLPASATLSAKAIAAHLSTEPPASIDPPDGVADLAGNSLDGDNDGVAQGPGSDDYTWTFKTTNEIDLVPPTVQQMMPSPGASGISASAPMSAVFSKLLRSSSITADSFKLLFGDADLKIHFQVGVRDSNTESFLQTFSPFLETGKTYTPQLSSAIQDTHQNCYFPCAAEGTACTGASWSSPYPSCRL